MNKASEINPRVVQEKKDEACAMLKEGKPIVLVAEILNIPIEDLITMTNTKH